MIDGDALLGRAETLIAKAAKRNLQAEVYLEWDNSLEVELEKDAIANTGTSQSGGGSWRVVQDGRLGFAYFTTDKQAMAALELALRQSKHAPDKGFELPAAAKAKRIAGRWSDKVAALDVDAALAMSRDALQGAKEAAPKASVSGGGVGFGAGCVALASTQGVSCWDRATSASCGVGLVLEDGERSVSASESDVSHSGKLDAHAIAVEAAATVLSLVRPKKLTKGGRMDVVFRPDAGGELVSGLAVSAAIGDEARRGKTVWSQKLGEAVADKQLRIADDCTGPGTIGAVPFDDEGVPTRPVPIVEGGILRNFLYDSWDANEHKAKTTASASRGGFKSRPSTGVHHLVVEGSRPRKLDTLIGGIDKGILVESVLGAHTANVTTGDFSVTSPNLWRIEKGEVAGPLGEVAIGGNLPDLLMRLRGVSRESKQRDGSRIPHLHFGDVDVSV